MSGLPNFQPVSSRTRRDQVAHTLRQAILAGQMPGGTQLVEGPLATQLGVSRGLLREALRELIESGLVINRPYAGTFVTELSVEDLRAIPWGSSGMQSRCNFPGWFVLGSALGGPAAERRGGRGGAKCRRAGRFSRR